MGLSLEHTCWQSPFWGIHSITKTLVLASTILNSSCHAISAGTYLSTRQLVPVPGTPGQSISQTMTLPTSRPAPAWTYLAQRHPWREGSIQNWDIIRPWTPRLHSQPYQDPIPLTKRMKISSRSLGLCMPVHTSVLRVVGPVATEKGTQPI